MMTAPSYCLVNSRPLASWKPDTREARGASTEEVNGEVRGILGIDAAIIAPSIFFRIGWLRKPAVLPGRRFLDGGM